MHRACGEQRSRQCKGQRKNRVLELDHFEHGADAIHVSWIMPRARGPSPDLPTDTAAPAAGPAH
jgi:hypothetical protein